MSKILITRILILNEVNESAVWLFHWEESLADRHVAWAKRLFIICDLGEGCVGGEERVRYARLKYLRHVFVGTSDVGRFRKYTWPEQCL